MNHKELLELLERIFSFCLYKKKCTSFPEKCESCKYLRIRKDYFKEKELKAGEQ